MAVSAALKAADGHQRGAPNGRDYRGFDVLADADAASCSNMIPTIGG